MNYHQFELYVAYIKLNIQFNEYRDDDTYNQIEKLELTFDNQDYANIKWLKKKYFKKSVHIIRFQNNQPKLKKKN